MMLFYLTIVACLVPIQLANGYGYHHFCGATMSYSVKETNRTDINEIHLQLITGWVLGKGPCGPACSKNDVGRDSSQTRNHLIASHNSSYFGNWYEEYRDAANNQLTITRDISKEVVANMNEKVIGISEKAKWEQELMEVTFLISVSINEVDIKYTGQSWRDRNGQGNNMNEHSSEQWNVMTTVTLGIRSDTSKPNQSPKSVVKPVYRLKLNEVSKIQISTYDDDGDYVKCKQSKWSEAMSLSIDAVKGLTVDESCVITVNASSALGYTDNYWGGIAVTVRDYNRHNIHVGGKNHPNNYGSLSSSPVQFLVQIQDHLDTPEFITPTLEHNHEFVVYVGALWSAMVYAEASKNTTITEFTAYGIQNENTTLTDFRDDTLNRERVKQVRLSWKPETNEIGGHIICTRVFDNTGVDSAEDKCFIVNVKANTFDSTAATVSNDKPYFTNLPSNSENVSCKVDKTCVLPLYVVSNTKLDTIRVTSSAIDTIYFGEVLTNGTNVYQTDLFMWHSGYGLERICLIATDINGTSSEETCILYDIDSPDPCYSSPCQNFGQCIRRLNDTADYECNCRPNSFGRNCEKRAERYCDSSPCQNGFCVDTHGYNKCFCVQSGYTGEFCSVNTDDCNNVDCNNRGICKDCINTHRCQCFSRFNGTFCDHDRCPGEAAESETCAGDMPGCSPNICRHGVCVGNGNCICQLGYTADTTCTLAFGNIRTTFTNVTILPPTPEPRSLVVCYVSELCDLDIYFTSGKSATTSVTVNKVTPRLKNNITISNIQATDDIRGINSMLKVVVTVTAMDRMQGYMCVVISEGTLSDQRCFALKVIDNPVNITHSMEYIQKNRRIKFVDPTLRGESTFVCQRNKVCYIFLYTSLNMTASGSCDKPISTDDGVTLLNVEQTPANCKTQSSILIATSGNFYVCFQSTLISSESQKRCFNVQIYDRDPCGVADCQNNAECMYTDDILDNITCACQVNYRGVHCEKGPCQQADNNCMVGYCDVDNHVPKCMCPISYKGDRCEERLPDATTILANTGAQFTDAAVPTIVLCIRNRVCSVPLVVSGHYSGNATPDIRSGYTSTYVNITTIDTLNIGNGSFVVNLHLYGKRVGLHDTCIQTMNRQGVNMDELCFKVNVTEGTSTLYNDKQRPHFVEASVPPNSELMCKVDEPCHLLLNATPGEKYISQECVKMVLTPPEVARYHTYSQCEPCKMGSKDHRFCSFDIVFILDKDVEFCVEAVTTLSNVAGEKRCYKLKADFNRVNLGCQVVKCEKHGFCDGHVDPAVCHCPAGYSGNTYHIAHKRSIRLIKDEKENCACPMKVEKNTEISTAKFLQHAAYGAGGITWVYVICLVLYIIIKRFRMNNTRQNSVKRVQNKPN